MQFRVVAGDTWHTGRHKQIVELRDSYRVGEV